MPSTTLHWEYGFSTRASCVLLFFFSSRRRHTRCALVTGIQTVALPIWSRRLRLPAPAHPHALARAGEGYGVGLSPRPRRGDSCFRRPARIVGRDPIAGTGGTLAGGDPWPARGNHAPDGRRSTHGSRCQRPRRWRGGGRGRADDRK